MDSTVIRRRIRYYQGLLDETRENKRKIEEKLDNVRTFAARRQQTFTKMQEDLTSRRRYLTGSSIDASQVKTMKNLSQGMSDLLDQGNIHLSRMEEQRYQIGRVASNLEDSVSQYQSDENYYVDTLDDLKRELAIAEAEEAQNG